jgi:hypothetical protein
MADPLATNPAEHRLFNGASRPNPPLDVHAAGRAERLLRRKLMS